LKWDDFNSHPRQTGWVKLQISNSYVAKLWVLGTVLLKMQVLWDMTVLLRVQFNIFPILCEEHWRISFLWLLLSINHQTKRHYRSMYADYLHVVILPATSTWSTLWGKKWQHTHFSSIEYPQNHKGNKTWT
jgi:hypothetical protein